MPHWQVLHHLHPLDRGHEDRRFVHVANQHQDAGRGERQGDSEGDSILHRYQEVVPAPGLIIQALEEDRREKTG